MTSAPVPQPSRTAYGVPAADEVDRDLLRRISGADRDAFEQLYHGYYKRLARFLGRVTPRREDIEEVINDALFIVWQHAGDFRGASLVSTWIFGIAYRCALKSIRRSGVRSRAAKPELQSGEAVVEDAARQTEDKQLLDSALSCLPIEQRLVLVLAYYMDRSCEEIAAIVQCPVNTVKARMFHARRRLRSIISEGAAPQSTVVDADSGTASDGGALHVAAAVPPG